MNDISRYLQQVRSYLPGGKKENQWVLNQLQDRINETLQDPSYEKLVEAFGAPESLAAEQIANIPPEKIAKEIHLVHWIKKMVLIFIAILLILFSALAILEYIDGHASAQGQISEGGIVIEQSSSQVSHARKE